MYLKRVFKTRKGLVAAFALSAVSAMYHLYLLGRCDEIQEKANILRNNGDFATTFKLYDDEEIRIHMFKEEKV